MGEGFASHASVPTLKSPQHLVGSMKGTGGTGGNQEPSPTSTQPAFYKPGGTEEGLRAAQEAEHHQSPLAPSPPTIPLSSPG